MRQFTYRGVMRLGVLFLELGALAASSFFTLFMVWIVWVVPDKVGFLSSFGCLFLWGLLWELLLGLTLLNFYPTVWVHNGGLYISAFLIRRIFIPWHDIIDVGAGRTPFGSILVRARRITPFHRAYGLLYSRTLFPSFVISKKIEGYDELLREFKRRALMVSDG